MRRGVVVVDSSWDPPTRAHLQLAEAAVKTLRALPFDSAAFQENKSAEQTQPSDNHGQVDDLLVVCAISSANAAKSSHKASLDARRALLSLVAKLHLEVSAPKFVQKPEMIRPLLPSSYRDAPLFFVLGIDTLVRFLDQTYYETPLPAAVVPFFASGSRILCASRLPDATNPALLALIPSIETPSDSEDLDKIAVQTVLQNAICHGKFLAEWMPLVIPISGWTSTNSSTVPLAAISSSRARSLIADYYRARSAIPAPIQTSIDLHPNLAPIVESILEIIDKLVFEFIISNNLYMPTDL